MKPMLNVLFKGGRPLTKLFSNDSQPENRVKVELSSSPCGPFEARLGPGTSKNIEVKGRGLRINVRKAPFWALESCSNGLEGAGILCVSVNQARRAGNRKRFSAMLQYSDGREVPAKIRFLPTD